jgi:hypothetical protein
MPAHARITSRLGKLHCLQLHTNTRPHERQAPTNPLAPGKSNCDAAAKHTLCLRVRSYNNKQSTCCHHAHTSRHRQHTTLQQPVGQNCAADGPMRWYTWLALLTAALACCGGGGARGTASSMMAAPAATMYSDSNSSPRSRATSYGGRLQGSSNTTTHQPTSRPRTFLIYRLAPCIHYASAERAGRSCQRSEAVLTGCGTDTSLT